MSKNKKNNKKNKYSKKDLSNFIKNSLWAFKTIFRLSPRDAIIALLSSFLIAIIPIGTSFFSAKFIDEIIAFASDSTRGYSDLDLRHPIFIMLGISVFLNVINQVTRQLNRFMRDQFKRVHLRYYELELYRKISLLDVQQFESPQLSNSIQKAQDNFYKIHVFYDVTTEFLTQLISIAASATISFMVSPLIAIIVIVLSIPNNYFYAQFTNKIWGLYNSFIETNRKRWQLLGHLTKERDLPEQKINHSEQHLYEESLKISNFVWSKEIKIFKERFFTSLASTFINAINYIIVPIQLLSKYLTNQITLGDFTFYQGRFFDFSGRIDFLIGDFLDIYDSAVYIKYVRDIFELEPIIKTGEKEIDSTKPPKIEFRDVWFKYPNSDKYSLKGINLTINPGKEVALVGQNGAGKTTLVKLLLRFYDPEKGQILINDIPLTEINLLSYYKTISALFQEFNFYGSLTARENILLGKPDEEVNISKIKKAAKDATADTVIEELPHKYNQILSKQFSKGTNLSWGQMQRIALARMFYRDSPILILDEPTSAIDAQAEYEIFNRIYEFVEGKTVIVISHRFSTVKHADEIHVLENGEITESGSHEELLAKDGTYAKSFNLQADGYNN